MDRGGINFVAHAICSVAVLVSMFVPVPTGLMLPVVYFGVVNQIACLDNARGKV